MYKILRAIKDTYITDRVVKKSRQTSANVGEGGTLDLFKLYGITSTLSGGVALPNIERSRALVHFDLSPLRLLYSQKKIDLSSPSFQCILMLHDVYGGQPTPANFSLVVHPLSRSFTEGLGHDVVYYGDYDVANWLSASIGVPWTEPGCGSAGDGTSPSDYLSASYGGLLLRSSGSFVTGEEDLQADVTTVISATLAGLIPDNGFRISFSEEIENNSSTYFVKRFVSRNAYNVDLHPKLIIKYDSSILDDSASPILDEPNSLFLYNSQRNQLTNLLSGTQAVTGSNALLLELTTPVSGGVRTLYFTGSQYFQGQEPITGIYTAPVTISSSDPELDVQLRASGSITLTPAWKSFDQSVIYYRGEPLKFRPGNRGTSFPTQRYDVTVTGISDKLWVKEEILVRVNIFDRNSPSLLLPTKLPVLLPGLVVKDVYYQIRDVYTGRIPVPFDKEKRSTRVSSDSDGMYFYLDGSNLTPGRSYTVDLLFVTGKTEQFYESASPTFKVWSA